MSDEPNGRPPGQNNIYAPDTSVVPKEHDPSANALKSEEEHNELEELAANGESLPEPEDDSPNPPPGPDEEEGDEESGDDE